MKQVAEFFASIGFKVDTTGADKFTSYLDNTEKKLRSVRAEAVKLSKSLSNTTRVRQSLNSISTSRSEASTAKSISNLNNALQAGAPRLDLYTTKLGRLAGALDKVSIAAAKVHLPQGNISIRVPNADSGSNRVSNPRVGSVGFMPSLFGFGGSSFIRNMLPLAGASLSAALVKSVVKTGRSVQGSEIAIEATSADAATGKANVAFATDLANRLGTSLTGSLEQFGKILGSTQGSGLANNEVQEIFTAVNEFGVSRRVGDERLQLALRAIGQMASKQRVSAEELKNQFAEHMPGGLELARKAMGFKDVAELLSRMEDGEVLAKDLLPKLAKEMAAAARENDALSKALNTSAAAQGRFNNAITQATVKIYTKIDPVLSSIFNSLSALISKVDFDAVGKAIDVLLAPIAAMLNLLNGLAGAVQTVFEKLDWFTTLLVGAGLTTVLSFMGAFASIMPKIAAGLKLLRIASFGLLGPIGALVVGLLLVAEDIFMFFSSNGKASTVTGKLVELFEKMSDSASLAIKSAWFDVIQYIKSSLPAVLGNLLPELKDPRFQGLNYANIGAANVNKPNAVIEQMLTGAMPSINAMPAWNNTTTVNVYGNLDSQVATTIQNGKSFAAPPVVPKL